MDRKTFDTRLEIKFANTSGEEKTFTGYGAFFNNIDSYGDVIAPGAFTKTLADFNGSAQMPAMLWNHDAMAMPIGVWLDIAEDAHGLKVSGQFLDTTSGNDSYILAKTGAVSGLSIGYIVTGFEMSVVNGKSIRTITEVQLFEISLVTFPANDLARVQSVKNQENEVNIDEIKAMLDERDAKLKTMLEEMMVKSAPADTEVKSSDDDEDCDCDPDEDDDCDCDDEDKSEAKYNAAFIEAVNNLTRKLAKENHGR